MITKAIVPMAGFGTRRLPITKAIEKCMLPVGNRPIVDYVVEDCIKAGITDIIFVVGQQFEQLQTYYGRNALIEEYLHAKGKQEQLNEIVGLASKANFHYVLQDQHQPYGTCVPVKLCADFVGKGEQVLVLMGDDFIYNDDGKSEAGQLIKSVDDSKATAAMLATRVPKSEVYRYGVLRTTQSDGRLFFDSVVEQPKVEDAPSDLINISKYVLDYDLLRAVQMAMERPPAANGEYQITEALNIYRQEMSKPLLVVPATGQYLDCGSVEGWLGANNVVLTSK